MQNRRVRLAVACGLGLICAVTTCQFNLSTASAADTFKDVAAGSSHSCAILADKTVKCWGYNGSGQLGDGTWAQNPRPVAVSGLTGATQLALGSSHSCALVTGATAKCWGYNGSGQLGDGTFSTSGVPVKVRSLTGVKQIASGASHTCALVTGGKVKCWATTPLVSLVTAPARRVRLRWQSRALQEQLRSQLAAT